MEDRGERGAPFDERAALEELDRLQREIDQRRAEREAAAERFEAFIRSFTTPAASVPAEPARTPPAAGPGPRPAAPEAPTEAPLGLSADPLPRPSAPPSRKADVRTVVVWCGALLLLAAGAAGVWFWRQQVPEPAAATSPPAETPVPGVAPEAASPTPSEPAPTAQPEPAPPPAERLELEITTSDTVWVRVLADGERVLERELPANSRVPVSAGKTIVIRSGNAGAVHVSQGAGKPEPLGQEGQVVTRTFTRR